jgi:hypothetical protein
MRAALDEEDEVLLVFWRFGVEAQLKYTNDSISKTKSHKLLRFW